MAGRGSDRLVVGVLEACCRRLWGFAPSMITSIVAHKGPVRAFSWFAVNMPRYLITMRVFGPVRTHLACATVSLYHGCSYCAFGQLYALELIYLRDAGRLFPLNAFLLTEWLDLDPRVLRARLRRVLEEAGLQTEAAWMDLSLAFAAGDQQPIDEAEVRLAHLVGMIGEMSRIAVGSGDEPDGAHDSVNKDRSLRFRHAALRKTSSSPA